ncbi:MAG: SDR family oxidoreductase [Lentisphaerae bacterium]|nr:SDR family oxidoreductase [Lentisphaerota bacterium]
MKTVMVTGGAGYIGSVLCERLLDEGHRVICLDRCFFGTASVAHLCAREGFRLEKTDTRFCGVDVFEGVDVVMDLAGISNDPSCDLKPELTEEINLHGSVRIARCAADVGVSRYCFSSSCSIYGASSGGNLTEESPQHPISLYAECKQKAEEQIGELASDDFCVTFLRNATAFGASRRMRFDLMINLMTACAVTQRKIFVMGGGKQWRPTVHVRDIAEAFVLVMGAPADMVNREAFNVGVNDQNYRVLQVAHAVADLVPNAEIDVVPADPDRRDYHVCFDKISDALGYRSHCTVQDGILEVKKGIEDGEMSPDDIQTSTVGYYRYLMEADQVLASVKLDGRLF